MSRKILIITLAAVALVAVGWLVLSSQQGSFDSAKVKQIRRFNKATPSLQAVLVNDYFDDSKAQCEQEKRRDPERSLPSYIIRVDEMVRDDFAAIQFCAGHSALFYHQGDQWKVIASLSDGVQCDIVEAFKVSKEIVPRCLLRADGSGEIISRPVVYP